MLTHGSLFSGIGGFDLAAEWMGWDNKFHCEWNPFGQKILKHYWPDAQSYNDITKTDFSIHRGKIDVLSGGFPCQPYSQAGKRLGKEDDRHLWPEMLRAIREIQPGWVVGENVRGLTNWNGGLVFDEVQADLEAQGYEVTPFLLPACAVNAPHRRDRIWFVAYAGSNVHKGGLDNKGDRNPEAGSETKNQQPCGRDENREWVRSKSGTSCENVTNSHSEECERRSDTVESEWQKDGQFRAGMERTTSRHGEIGTIADTGSAGQQECHTSEIPTKQRYGSRLSADQWANWPTQSPVCDGNDGFPTGLDGITFSKWRNESIKAGGNAIVPQVAHQIFKAIEQYLILNS